MLSQKFVFHKSKNFTSDNEFLNGKFAITKN